MSTTTSSASRGSFGVVPALAAVLLLSFAAVNGATFDPDAAAGSSA